MHWKLFLESDVVRAIDLGTKDHVVEIAKVERGKVTGAGGKKSGKCMLHLKGKDKPVACGSTVLKTIAGMYGDDTRAWVGKLITIYCDPGVMYGGEKVGGVRCRPTPPQQGGAQ
jgi:hypothetical protein